MKGMSWIWGALALGGLMACAVPAGPTPNVDTGGVDLNKPAAVIKSLVAGKVELPKSLQEESTIPVAGSMRQIGRAAGDISTLTSLNLPSLKAEGYQDFKDMVTRPPVIQMFLDALKTSDVIKNETLVPGQTADLGTVLLYGGSGSLNVSIPSAGKILTELSADGQTLYIYWAFSYPDMSLYYSQPEGNPIYATMQDCANDLNARIALPIYFVIQKSGAMSMWASSDEIGLEYFTKYDPVSKGSVIAGRNGTAPNTSESLNLVQPQADGSFFLYTKTTYNGSNPYLAERMGYANDSYGGIITSGLSTYSGVDYPFVNVEYYDGSGDLIYQGWGDSAVNNGSWSWLAQSAAYAANLYQLTQNKPKNVTLRFTQDYNVSPPTKSTEISIDGLPFVAFNPAEGGFNGWSLVYHATSDGDSPTEYDLQPGDAYYSTSKWDSESLSSNVWRTTITYYKAYEVPAGESYFGNTYIVNKSFPLKNLLPLSGEYTDYEVKQKEGSTWYSWKTPSGNWQSSTTEPVVTEYVPDTLSSWTDYSYWLENTAFVNTDPNSTVVNNPDSLDTEKGDVSFRNLNNMQVWYWDMEARKSKSRQTAAYSTYSDLPPYFSVNTAQLEATEQTKATLEAFYAKRNTYDVETYLADFDAVMGAVTNPVTGKMPSLD